MEEPPGMGTLPDPLWHFAQVFGERQPGDEIQDADIISAIEFDATGDQLATGDRGGRVVLFQRVDSGRGEQDYRDDEPAAPNVEYRYLTEFQSHEPEFDYLKSLEIEEKINKIRWCKQGANNNKFVLSTNDKTIKLWKVSERKVKTVSFFNTSAEERAASGALAGVSSPLAGDGPAFGGAGLPPELGALRRDVAPGLLRLPQVTATDSVYVSRCRRVFSSVHAYHINSISVNSDGQTFLSADDLRVNLWTLEESSQSFTIVDIKPANMEDLTEVITAATFHPQHCNIFAYSSSKGCIRLADMRESALCDRHTKLFEEPEPAGAKSFFSEIVTSISDVQFGGADGRYLLSRDYLALKLWDVKMEGRPLATFKVHEGVRSKLCDLYENDSIFDKFECCVSGSGEYVASGSYSHLFSVFNVETGNETSLEVSKDPYRRRFQQGGGDAGGGGGFGLQKLALPGRGGQAPPGPPPGAPPLDFSQKLLHLAWHPQCNVVAAAASNSLYILQQDEPERGR